jgi:Ca-activated chloride channel homolog
MKWYLGAYTCCLASLAFSQPVFTGGIELVRVPCGVVDSNGAPVGGLSVNDFVVLEDGLPQDIKYLWRDQDLPLTIGILGCCLTNDDQRAILKSFSTLLSPQDRAFLISVLGQPRLTADWTSSADDLRAGAEEKRLLTAPVLGEPCSGVHPTRWSKMQPPCGSTVLWDGVISAARWKLRSETDRERKALLIMADGWDTGSDHTVREAIKATQQADAVVFSVRLNNIYESLLPQFVFSPFHSAFVHARSELAQIARETGGLALEGERSEVPSMFSRVESDLRKQYVLAYTPRVIHPAGSYHKLEVRLKHPAFKIRSRIGYYTQ